MNRDFEECVVIQQLVTDILRDVKYGELMRMPMLYEFYLHQLMENLKSTLHI